MERALTVVSNRLPIVLNQVDGAWRVEEGSGGLVQAMRPLLERREGRWIGWPGTTEPPESGWGERLASYDRVQPFEIVPVGQTPEEYRGYYVGCANSILWPLFHEVIDHCEFDRWYFEAYRRVNRRFAEAIHRSIVMPRRERVGRMRQLRRTIHQTDVYQWAESFLAALGESRCSESRRRNRSTSSGPGRV